MCALLNASLETWSGKIRNDVDIRRVEMAFLPQQASRLKEISTSAMPPRVVFHRMQILFIAKQAALCCEDHSENVFDLFRVPYWNGLGIAFLMVNNLLHHDFAYREQLAPQQLLIRMIHSIPLLESWHNNAISYRISRSWLMLKRFGPTEGSASYLNIEQVFQSASGISTEEYLALCCAMISHYLDLTFEKIAETNNSTALNKEWFTKAGVDAEVSDRFLDDVSASPEAMAGKFAARDWGPSDITWFRDKPVSRVQENVLFAMDTKVLTEKLDSGIFWKVHNSLDTRKEKERLHNYWGVAFENYMNWLLEEACRNGPNQFYASPRYVKSGAEVCDAIVVSGSDAVFIEYKGSTFTAESKYKGDVGELAVEIEENLIGTPAKRKGVCQISHAIGSVFDKHNPSPIFGIDLSQINTIFSMLVTRDDVGGCWGISHYLQLQADTFLNRRNVRPKTVTPIFSLSSEGVEGISAYLHEDPLPRLLNGWYKNDPERYWSFQTIPNPIIDSRGLKTNAHLDATSKRVFEDAIRLLFPGATSADAG